MKSLEELNIERPQHQAELDELNGQIAQYEEHLSDPDYAETPAGNELQILLGGIKSKVGGIKHKIFVIDQDIAWYDRKANSTQLLAEYNATMQNWSLDKLDLEGKRKALSERLLEVQNQSEKVIADARRAEEQAAQSYAQAVAWGDGDGEKKAAEDAQKAAKALSTAMENQRRQGLIITALQQEIETVDAAIEEANQEILKAESHAVLVALERLEEQWDTTVKQLLDVGAKLYAAKRYMGREEMAFYGFKVGSQTESFTYWDAGDIRMESSKYSPAQLIAIDVPASEPLSEVA